MLSGGHSVLRSQRAVSKRSFRKKQDSSENGSTEKQERVSIWARTTPRDLLGLRELGRGGGSVASPQSPSAIRAPVLPDHLDTWSRCLMYSCTQATLGLAQICRPCRVRKLWNKKEKEGKLSQQAERSPAPSLPSLSFPTSLSAGRGPFTQRRTLHSLLLPKESVKTLPPAPITSLEAKLRLGSPQGAAQLVLPVLPPLPS